MASPLRPRPAPIRAWPVTWPAAASRQVLNMLQMWARNSSRLSLGQLQSKMKVPGARANSPAPLAVAACCSRTALPRLARFSRRSQNVSKDEMLRHTAFTATKKMFNAGETLRSRTDCFFVDYSMVPLLMQTNYVDAVVKGPVPFVPRSAPCALGPWMPPMLLRAGRLLGSGPAACCSR